MQTVIIIFSLAWLSFSCPASTLLTQYQGQNCTFNFQFYSFCTTYSFQSCQISSCINGHCSTSSNNDYSICMQSCCLSAPQGDQYEFATQCANSSQQPLSEMSKILMVVMVIFGCIMVIMFIICIIWIRLKKKSQTGIRPQAQPQFQNPELNPKIVKCQPSREGLSIQQLLEWKEGDQETGDIDCVICLGEKPNLKLECGHKFHPHCFLEWLKKKRECGVCRGTKILKYVLLCRKCFKRQVAIGVHELKHIKKMKEKQTCEECNGQ